MFSYMFSGRIERDKRNGMNENENWPEMPTQQNKPVKVIKDKNRTLQVFELKDRKLKTEIYYNYWKNYPSIQIKMSNTSTKVKKCTGIYFKSI